MAEPGEAQQNQQNQTTTSTVAWRYPEFRFYSISRFLGTTATEAQAVGVAWQIYQMTHSALALGYTGLALFLPAVVFVLPAGHVADLFDRRKVILTCYTVQLLANLVLLAMTLHGLTNVWLVYAVLFLIGTSRSFAGPAQSSLVPTLVPKEHFVNAVTWGASIFQFAQAFGPMLGGILFTLPLGRMFGHGAAPFAGAPLVYSVVFLLHATFLVTFSQIGPRAAADKKAVSVETMLAGLRYVFSTRLLLGSMSLDLFAVLFGGATALMPIFAEEVLHAGPTGLGLLRAMPSLGALAMSLLLTLRPMKRRAGKTMLTCVGIFSTATIVFGLSKSLPLSCAALVILGATDMVSVVVRQSVLQLATPPEMRGRVSSVNWLFLGTSNELGEYESGLTAHWWGAVRAVVIGGVASLSVVGVWSFFFPALRHADQLTAESLIEVEKQFSAREDIRR